MVVKKAEKVVHKTPLTKKYHLTLFKIKLALFVAVTFLSYRYDFPVDSFENQEITVLLVTSFLLLAKPSPYYRLMKKFSHTKPMFVLIYLTFIVPVLGYADTRYFDWDNAQMIKGLARDFPVLVAEIEAATGLDLEQKTDCMTTTEKFTNGVKTCELIAGIYIEEDSTKNLKFKEIATSGSIFKADEEYENGKGTSIQYRNKKNCGVGIGARGKGTLSISCIIGVREANISLALDEFSNN